MTELPALWLPILLSAVFVFVVSAVVHMVLPVHKGDFGKLPDEDATLAAMRKVGVTPGQFMFPYPASMREMNTPAMQAKYAAGPVGMLIVRENGDLGMGKALGAWFLFCVLIGVFTAYLTGLSVRPGAAFAAVFRVSATVALLGHAFWSVHDSIWKGVSWSTTGKYMLDGLAYALVTGAVFAWLWPAA
ncbi:MAG: hypothetical protein MUC36_22165 [Planctomycetes bacterium]|nr:hypothetical protein [Planctomycetota bacterium]